MNTGRASINDGGRQVHFLPFPALDLIHSGCVGIHKGDVDMNKCDVAFNEGLGGIKNGPVGIKKGGDGVKKGPIDMNYSQTSC